MENFGPQNTCSSCTCRKVCMSAWKLLKHKETSQKSRRCKRRLYWFTYLGLSKSSRSSGGRTGHECWPTVENAHVEGAKRLRRKGQNKMILFRFSAAPAWLLSYSNHSLVGGWRRENSVRSSWVSRPKRFEIAKDRAATSPTSESSKVSNVSVVSFASFSFTSFL